MLYEIPVAGPWGPRSEQEAFKNTLAQAVAADAAGFELLGQYVIPEFE